MCNYYLASVARSIFKSNFHTSCVFLSVSKFAYPLTILRSKILFISINFITSCCPFFACVLWLILDYTVMLKISFVSMHFYYKLLHLSSRAYLAWEFRKFHRVYFEIASMVLPFVILPFLYFSNESNQVYKPILNLWTLSFLLKSVSKETNHIGSHGIPM